MKVHKKYKPALDEFVRRLLAARRRPDDPGAAVDGFAFEAVVSVVETAIDFPPEIPEIERRTLTSSAAWALLTRDPRREVIDGAVLEAELRAAESAYLRQPLRDLVVVGSLALHRPPGLRRARVLGATIQFGPSRSTRFNRAALEDDFGSRFPNGYREDLPVRMAVRARTTRAAVDQALYRLDLVRGYWNFALNWRTLTRESAGERRPVNEILPGPITTVHTPGGALAADEWWYEPQSVPWHWVARIDEARWRATDRFRAQMARWERRVPYGAAMRDLLVRYVRALDGTQYDVAFSRLWAVLERLLGFGREVGHGDLVARLRFLYPADDQHFITALLEHLRDVRNGLVHEDRGRARMEAYLYQLKGCVERVVWYYVRHGHRFGSFAEAAAFLDHSPDLAELQREAAVLKRAVRMRTRATRPRAGFTRDPEAEPLEESMEVPPAAALDASGDSDG